MKTPKLLSFMFLFVFCGCNQQKFSNIDNGGTNNIVSEKGRPACEVPEIDYQLSAQVVEFDVTSKKGFHFGFSLIPGFEWFKAFDALFSLKRSSLTISTSMSEYLKPMEPLGQATGNWNKDENFWGLDIDLNKLNAGGSSFASTPFFVVMTEALRKSIRNTVKVLSGIEAPWNTVIVSSANESQFIIPAGKNAGIQVGDQFEIYNIEHEWVGEPCKSAYRMATTTTENPIAIVEVKNAKDLTPNVARLLLKEKLLDERIEQGAFVYIHKLTSKRTLKRSLFVQEIKPFKITWQSGNNQNQEFEITALLQTALGPVLRDAGFYIKPKANEDKELSWTDEP